jgi:arylsulfatase A
MTLGSTAPLSRRHLFGAVGMGMSNLLSTNLRASARPPNVILLMADDAGYECFAPYGSRQYCTPALSRLARNGVRFNHCYATPLCTPTRVALMTGQNNVRNYTDFGAILPGQYTFADLFHRAGYASAIAGKWQLQGTPNAKGIAPADAGFDTYCLWNTGRTSPDRYWKPSIECDGKLINGREDQYGPDLFSTFLPTPDSRDRKSEDLQINFTDMVAYCDKIVGRFLDTLERLKLHDNTIFIFTGDNGAEHTIVSRLNGRTIRGDKGRSTAAGTHVPLIVAGPGIPAGRIVNDLVDFTDFLPTLADATGSRLPSGIPFDGQSFWPQLTGAKGRPRETIFNYYFPRPYSKAFNSPYRHPEVRYAFDHRYKLYGDGRLFDTEADPREEHPLPVEADTATLEAVRAKLQAAIDRMPVHGLQIPREHWLRSQGVPPPIWH